MGVAAASFIMMTFSLSEMVSIVPFSGGCYGYVRCTLGTTLGYITGVMEASKYVMYSAGSCYLAGAIFAQVFDFDDDKWLPVIWLALYLFAIVVPMLGTKVIWWCWGILAMTTLVVQLIFIFGAIKHGKIRNLGPRFNDFDNSSLSFFESNKVVPWAMVVVIFSSSLLALATVVSARMYEVNYIKFALYNFPYDLGLLTTLGKNVDARFVTFFSLPALLGGFLAMTFAGGRQMCSMACSGLLPKALGIVQREDDEVLPLPGVKGDGVTVNDSEKALVMKETKPILAIVTTCMLGYFLLVGLYYSTDNFVLSLVAMAGAQSLIQTFFTMGAYLVFATRFSCMERGFKSPFGMTGAILVMAFTVMVLFSLFYYGSTEVKNGRGIGESLFFAVCMIYYYVVANKRQFFSKEEQDRFMKAYVVNANKKRRGAAASGKGKQSNFPSTILTFIIIMKRAFSRRSVATVGAITASNSVQNGFVTPLRPGQSLDLGMKGNKVAPNISSKSHNSFSIVP
eukprot:scaffold5903_cov165-Ochromonas_danica.AAC.15